MLSNSRSMLSRMVSAMRRAEFDSKTNPSADVCIAAAARSRRFNQSSMNRIQSSDSCGDVWLEGSPLTKRPLEAFKRESAATRVARSNVSSPVTADTYSRPSSLDVSMNAVINVAVPPLAFNKSVYIRLNRSTNSRWAAIFCDVRSWRYCRCADSNASRRADRVFIQATSSAVPAATPAAVSVASTVSRGSILKSSFRRPLSTGTPPGRF
jgi:hypothetical protein